MSDALFEYTLRIGDNCLVLGHRLSEWCGHGPALEEDIALTNVALDLVGQARMLLEYAAKIEDQGRSEDDLAYLRDGTQYRNVLLVEQPNGDYAQTIARQFFFDAFMRELWARLAGSADERLAAIAAKSAKENAYHLRHSSQWMIRFGDGTDESHERVQRAVDELWRYTGELMTPDDTDRAMLDAGIGVDLDAIRTAWSARVDETFAHATLTRPDNDWMASGGKSGRHSEHLGYILAELQYLQRAYPGASW